MLCTPGTAAAPTLQTPAPTPSPAPQAMVSAPTPWATAQIRRTRATASAPTAQAISQSGRTQATASAPTPWATAPVTSPAPRTTAFFRRHEQRLLFCLQRRRQ